MEKTAATADKNNKQKRSTKAMKSDPANEPDNNVVVSKPASETEVGSSIVRRNEADDED